MTAASLTALPRVAQTPRRSAPPALPGISAPRALAFAAATAAALLAFGLDSVTAGACGGAGLEVAEIGLPPVAPPA